MSSTKQDRLHDILEQAAELIIKEFPKEADGLGTYLMNQKWYVGIHKVTKGWRLTK